MTLGRDVDNSIIQGCNDLIAEQTYSAKLRAEQQTELRKVLQVYQNTHGKWQEQLKPSKGGSSKTKEEKEITALCEEQVSQAFSSDPERNIKMSPYLLGQLSQLCYHIHLMTRLEGCAAHTIHEDYRVIVNWIHESWEEMETESRGMKDEVETVQLEIKTLRRQQRERIRALQEQHEEEKRKLTIDALTPKEEEEKLAKEEEEGLEKSNEGGTTEHAEEKSIEIQKSEEKQNDTPVAKDVKEQDTGWLHPPAEQDTGWSHTPAMANPQEVPA
jgi:hypothetical protein